MKVLFIGHYREQSGWGKAAIEYILALDAAGVDVVCRPIKLNQSSPRLPSRIKELERKSDKGCDVCIQNLLPHMLFYNGKFKRNICIPFIDTTNLVEHSWLKYFKLFEVWSPYKALADEFKMLGYDSPVVHVPCDPSKYLSSMEPLDLNINLKGKFVFYSIFDSTPRKNIIGLLKAFHLEFKPYENVELLIKTSKAGQSAEGTRKKVVEMNNRICQGLKLYQNEEKYKKPFVITEELTDSQIDQLHHTCDSFVLPSCGEAWCLPAFDAMGYGKFPVVTKGTSCEEYVEHLINGYLVDGHVAPVTGMIDTFGDIFTANEHWIEPDIFSIMKGMRRAYNLRNDREEIRDISIEEVSKFSHHRVGKQMKELLCTTP